MIQLWSVRTERRSAPFSLVDLLDELAGRELRNGDVVVISSKFVAISEGRVVKLESVVPSQYATELSTRYNIPPQLCELIVRESDEILGGVVGFILASKEGMLSPNAGIDRSNIEPGRAVLYPRDPLESASAVVESVEFRRGIRIAVVICDSRLMPTRKGTTGVALASSGLEAVLDLRGKEDLFGNILRVTSQAIADDLCSAAQLVMGESDEGAPFVVIRGLKDSLIKKSEYPTGRFSVKTDQCVYMRSLGYRPNRTSLRASRHPS
ncbi:MAG: coenzyme F420-0:L-glutamate ligase [Thaumarchaeota archaeon]|nr:coenzyme F420-0:L-glutamate ligase [Nitrososphaerota archaeon]